MDLTWEESKRLAGEHIRQVVKDLASVQPMPSSIMKDLMEAGKAKEQLVLEGYEPVSSLGLLWIKKG